MKVLDQDRSEGLIRLRADTMDDLWHLYQLVHEGDRVTKDTKRSPGTEDDKIRPEKRAKEPMTLTLEVTDVEFHEFTDRLRIGGTILEGPQDLGSHHTFNVETGDDLTIVKQWRPHHLDRIQQAVDATDEPQLFIVAVEVDEAAVGVLRHYGLRKVTTITAQGTGKGGEGADEAEAGRDAFYDRILQAVIPLGGDELPVLIVGPGFAKENFMDHARDRAKEQTDHWRIDSVSQGGWPGVQEALNRGIVERVAEQTRVAKESRAVEELLQAIAQDEPVAYGPDDVEHALELGAVETLLITDELVRSKEADAYLDQAEETGADYMTISTHHEAGEKLASFGGVAAKLRYAIR